MKIEKVLFGVMAGACAVVIAVLCLHYGVYETAVGCFCLTVIGLVGTANLLLMGEVRKERKRWENRK